LLGPASAGITVRLDELDVVILAGAGEFNEHSITVSQHLKGEIVQKMANRAITKSDFQRV